MKFTIGVKLFLAYFIISGAIAWFVIDKASIRIVKGIDEAAEEVMIDASNLLAQMVSDNINNDQINTVKIKQLMHAYLARTLKANIYSTTKQKPNLQIYITNEKGWVIYDSTGKSTGKDYSKWRDVSLTLKGEYGARVSSLDPNAKNPTSEQNGMFVAAPIYHNGKILGVLSMVKSMLDLKPYVVEQKNKIEQYGLYLFLLSLLFGAGVSYFVSRGIKKIIAYTTALSEGKSAVAPNISQIEFSQLSNAIEKLRDDLEGKEYVEEYINTMAHELRTPITGIRATAENLLVPMEHKQRHRFVRNILDANKKMDLLVSRLLELSRIERRDLLGKVEKINIKMLIEETVKTSNRMGGMTAKSISLEYDAVQNFSIYVEKILVEQAIGNIIDNAIDFAPKHSKIIIKLSSSKGYVNIDILDEGPGIPEHAKKQLFRRFFSSARPDTGKQGNGLGLRFVKKIMDLHNGHITLGNRIEKTGVIATLKFPI